MKRHGNLWEPLISFPHLVRAMHKAARGKRRAENVARFLFDQERQLCRLQDELRQQTWRPGPFTTFEIHEPKRRQISAAPFRDRVVHHALVNVLEPIFEPCFIHDSYACRRRKGTHAAVARFQSFARRYRFVLQCDIRRYFPSVDHEVLRRLLRRKLKDARALELIDRIIDHSGPPGEAPLWLPGDDLFAPLERRTGLPLGNQTSQFFANVYLNGFDHFVMQDLRPGGYLRYVDDFALFADDRRQLRDARDACRASLEALHLQLHPDKSVISRTRDGVRFLGYRVHPCHCRLPRPTVTRWRRRLARLRQQQGGEEGADPGRLQRVLAGWWGHACPARALGLLADLVSGRSAGRRAS